MTTVLVADANLPELTEENLQRITPEKLDVLCQDLGWKRRECIGPLGPYHVWGRWPPNYVPDIVVPLPATSEGEHARLIRNALSTLVQWDPQLRESAMCMLLHYLMTSA